MALGGRIGDVVTEGWHVRSAWTAAVVACAAMLVLLFVEGRPLVHTLAVDPDSFGYLQPGLRLAAGQGCAGCAFRDVGYPGFALMSVWLGGLHVIPTLQLVAVLTGMLLCLVGIAIGLRTCSAGLQPGAKAWVVAASIAGWGCIFPILLLADNEFVYFISGIRPEALLVLLLSAAFVCILIAFERPAGGGRLVMLASASGAAFLGVILKPVAIVPFVFCIVCLMAGLIGTGRRSLRLPGAAAACATTSVVIALLSLVDASILKPGYDFGPRTLFCNHLPEVVPVLGSSTPERKRLTDLLQGVEALGPHGWPALGFNGDVCVNDRTIYSAIEEARQQDKMSSARWLSWQFLRGVADHPLQYGSKVVSQVRLFVFHPVPDIDMPPWQSRLSDDDWRRLQPFQGLMGQSRETLSQTVTNRFEVWAPGPIRIAKRLLGGLDRWFWLPVCLATLTAVATLLAGNQPVAAHERVVLASVGFVLSCVLTTAMSHSFDISRYAVGLLPFSLSLAFLSAAFLVRTISDTLELAVRLRREG